MKKLLVGFTSALLLFSCKFSQTSEGVYTGDFYSSSLPISSGNNATVTITQQTDGKFSGTLSYPGNPDVVVQDMDIERIANLDGNTFEAYYSEINEYLRLTVKEYDNFNGIAWNIFFEYSNDITNTSFTFTGTKK